MNGVCSETNLNCPFSPLQVIGSPGACDMVVMETSPLRLSLLCTKAPAVTKSHYTIKPSGNGMMCGNVVLSF